MHNNLIYVTGEGLLDAAEISDDRWTMLCLTNRPSTKREMVKCAWCWDERKLVRWMRTYDMKGARTVSHQPGEGDNHPYQTLETPEHKAYNRRAARVGEAEGYDVEMESWATDRATRADVLLRGACEIAYEHQHSPFKKGRGALERTRLANAAGRSVLWHTDQRKIAGAAKVAMARNDRLPLKVIEKPDYEIKIVSGYRTLVFWRCTAAEGHRCPSGRTSGCSEDHVASEARGITLDDLVRRSPAGLILPIHADRLVGPRDFLTDRESYERYENFVGHAATPALDGSPADEEKKRATRAQGHSLPPESVDGRNGSVCIGCGRPVRMVDPSGDYRHFGCDGRPVEIPAARRAARPRIEVITHSRLDWRGSSHWCTTSAQCRYCPTETNLRDGTGRPAHKVCAEKATAATEPGGDA